jgi:metallophosphoesterase (TIGR00282 family)
MKLIMIGDVVGEPGLETLERRLPALIAEYKADFTLVNGENAANGFGLTEETLHRILATGADVVTGGNHNFEKREFWQTLESNKNVLRPANYPSAPGTGWLILKKNGLSILAINLQCREQRTPLDCPFRCFDSIINGTSLPFVIVDFHAESTAEKEALGYYLDGRASLVAGTHTHVQTADERILPRGTAYISDLGMTGAMTGIIGMDRLICISRAYSQVAHRMECARPEREEDYAIQGIIAELDNNGRALSIERLNR